MALLLPACSLTGHDEREEEQRALRAERLARARAARARRARLAQRGRPARPGNPGTTRRPAPPDGPCDPATALKRRVGSAAFNDRFARAVDRVLTPVGADLVVLGGKPMQRFTFTVRMHPADEPAFGGRRPSGALLLDLRYVPLCVAAATPTPVAAEQTRPPTASLRVGVVKAKGTHPPRGSRTSLWPHRAGGGPYVVPVGLPIQLLLDPARPSLRRTAQAAQATPASPRGVWEIVAARFAGRRRTRRLSLATSQLGERLREVHLVEVVCGRPGKRCRFLTRQQGRRSVVTRWKDLTRLAAPLASVAQVRQLHRALLALRFPDCGGDARRPTRSTGHPCLRGHAGRLACLYWRAHQGFGNEPIVTALGDAFHVRHVVSCAGKKLRVVELAARFERSGGHTLAVKDLTAHADALEAQLRRLTSRRRRR
jgi:hypothetical protein